MSDAFNRWLEKHGLTLKPLAEVLVDIDGQITEDLNGEIYVKLWS